MTIMLPTISAIRIYAILLSIGQRQFCFSSIKDATKTIITYVTHIHIQVTIIFIKKG